MLNPRGTGSTLPLWCPAGGLPSLPSAAPAFTFFFAPYPPSPLPRWGRGEIFSFLMQGAVAPCIPTSVPNAFRHTGWFAADGGRLSVAEGLATGASGALLRLAVPEGAPMPGAVSFFLPSYKSFAPFPHGKGGTFRFILSGGCAPGTPRLCRAVSGTGGRISPAPRLPLRFLLPAGNGQPRSEGEPVA